ncbi:MAG: glutamine synthetase III [Erysipelotrichaceae bacterium]|nr:glutamine synthetase III [Erysipelotrichaceae bacterium]
MEKTVFKDFASMVFSKDVMKEYLPKDVFKKFLEIKESSGTLDKTTADAIAHGMKEWAISKGCTHYTHWFQPLTGSTAEKHDAFIDSDDEGKAIIRFDGKTLIKGEPDASSFPSGGLRSTFEARGYTYWDYTSPAFIRNGVLCIPSVFVSYYGESLDKKGPLLKSMALVSEKASELLRKIGYEDVKKVTPMVGLEQEYFLIDRPLYKERMDLMLTGRTLFGHAAPKGQEFDDHYFGAIPTRVQAFMKEVNEELWKLGIFVKTEHNEVAPMQFELAPLFCDANIAVDQNQLIMDILKRVAHKHGYACLLHEKPFDSINGSGKHNNYSLVSDTGVNVFDAGKSEKDHLKFLLFTSCFVKAVDTYPELLRLSAANPGNDFRLGCNEAPPAIISIFLGDYVESIIDEVVNGKTKETTSTTIEGLSYIPKDATDRNRTSPVAFTGNKFEFRMLGSSVSPSFPNVVLNTIIADSIDEFLKTIEDKKPEEIKDIIIAFVKETFEKHSKVLFSKNGYSEEWVEEAARRGLPNIKSSIEAIAQFDLDKNVELLTKHKVFTKVEIDARKEVLAEQYVSSISLEVKSMLYMAESYIIPFMEKEIRGYKEISESVFAVKRKDLLVSYLDSLALKLDTLRATYASVSIIEDSVEKGLKYRSEIVPMLADIKDIINDYEKIANKEIYTLPTYPEMLY